MGGEVGQGGQELPYGLVVGRHRAVAGSAPGRQLHPQERLLRQGAGHDRRLGLGEPIAALVDDVAAGDQVRMVFGEPPGALPPAGLLVGHGHEEQVALERRGPLTGECEHRHELHDAHALHVDGAPAPQVAVAELAGERVDGPFGRVGRHDVEVVEQAERAAGIAGPARQPGDEVASAGLALERGGLEPRLTEDAGQELRRRGLVPGRIRRVDTDVLTGDLDRLVAQRLPVRAVRASARWRRPGRPATSGAGRRCG